MKGKKNISCDSGPTCRFETKGLAYHGAGIAWSVHSLGYLLGDPGLDAQQRQEIFLVSEKQYVQTSSRT